MGLGGIESNSAEYDVILPAIGGGAKFVGVGTRNRQIDIAQTFDNGNTVVGLDEHIAAEFTLITFILSIQYGDQMLDIILRGDGFIGDGIEGFKEVLQRPCLRRLLEDTSNEVGVAQFLRHGNQFHRFGGSGVSLLAIDTEGLHRHGTIHSIPAQQDHLTPVEVLTHDTGKKEQRFSRREGNG